MRYILAALTVLSLVLSACSSGTVQEGTPADTEGKPITIQGFKFSPASFTISAGESITWKNEDSAPHSIVFDTGDLGESPTFDDGELYTQRFDTPGTYEYHCGIHPTMKGTIIVE